jgi:hypothetical protein
VTWPNGSSSVELDPKDYYRVRFARAEVHVEAGAVGLVVDHVGGQDRPGCVVEVGPWDEHGAPRDVVVASAGCLELLPPVTSSTPIAEVDAELKRLGIDVAPGLARVREAVARARERAACRPDAPCFADDCPSCLGGPGGT